MVKSIGNIKYGPQHSGGVMQLNGFQKSARNV